MITDYTVLKPAVLEKLNEMILSTPQQRNIYHLAAETRVLPENNSRVLRSRRYNALDVVPVPVNPAMMNPTVQPLTATDFDIQVNWYATSIVQTREVYTITQEDTHYQAALRLGQWLRGLEDRLYRDMLTTTAGTVNFVHGTNGDNPTEPTLLDFQEIHQTLYSNDCDYITSSLEASDRIGTAGIRESYIAMCSSDLIPDLQNVTGFLTTEKYPRSGVLNNSEFGAVENFRVFLSSNGAMETGTSLLGNDVYPIVIAGAEGYMGVDLDRNSSRIIYHPFGSDNDPGEFRSTHTAVMTFGAGITNKAWVISARCTKG